MTHNPSAETRETRLLVLHSLTRRS